MLEVKLSQLLHIFTQSVRVVAKRNKKEIKDMRSKKIEAFILANPHILDESDYDVDMFEEVQSCRWHQVYLSKPYTFEMGIRFVGGDIKDILHELKTGVEKISDEEWDYINEHGEPSDNYKVIDFPKIK